MIVLQFAAGKDLGADAIKWFGGGPAFSHVDAVLPDGRLLGARSDVVGGRPAGVQARDPSYVKGCKLLCVEIQFGDEDAFYGSLQSQIGAPYDEEAIAGFIAGRDWRTPNAWFCSELVTWGLELAKVFRYPLASPENKVTPGDLILLLSALVPVTIPA